MQRSYYIGSTILCVTYSRFCRIITTINMQIRSTDAKVGRTRKIRNHDSFFRIRIGSNRDRLDKQLSCWGFKELRITRIDMVRFRDSTPNNSCRATCSIEFCDLFHNCNNRNRYCELNPFFKYYAVKDQLTNLGHHNFNKTDVKRRQTLGHPRSINPNMINHVPQQLPIIF